MFFSTIVVALSFLNVSLSAAEKGDPEDLSFLKKGAAIGDSYTAGIGAGNSVGYWCSRYDGAYPSLVAMQLGVSLDEMDFTFAACSGAVVHQISDQANALSEGQQFIIMSAGGNDAKLSDILDACVYKFKLIAGSECSVQLDKAKKIIESDKFHGDVDGLIDLAKTKLTVDGNIYYVGYAKFFDVSDDACDQVTWHLWHPSRAEVYLTTDRRQQMNDLVDAMNDVLRSAVQRAGSRVHFVDYDKYVGMVNGRFCQPGMDESSGRSANRRDAFFYEMKTTDEPTIDLNDDWHTELKARSVEEESDDIKNSTLGFQYGYAVQNVVDSGQSFTVNTDNADEDLQFAVEDYQIRKNKAKGRFTAENLTHANSSLPQTPQGDRIQRRAKRTSGEAANATVLTDGEVVSTERLISLEETVHLVIPDTTARAFHPTQHGHNIIANLILYAMAAVNAESMGISDFPTEVVNGTFSNELGSGDRMCEGDSSDTWSDRDAMSSAVKNFCQDLGNTRGSAGATTEATFNEDSLDHVKISIDWQDEGAIEEHSCVAWLNIITDGCDVPDDSGSNAGNYKHGGSMAYYSDSVNATFNVDPLVLRRIWSGGQATAYNCSEQKYYHMDQELLKDNIEDYCEKASGFTDGIAEAGSEFSQVYNEDSADRVTLKTEWPSGQRDYQIFKDECEYYMNKVFDGCTGLNDDASDDGWNYGGEMFDNNGVKYTIAPSEFRRSGNFFVGNNSHWNSSNS